VKVAFDGERERMKAPLCFSLHTRPLWLVAPTQLEHLPQRDPANAPPAAAQPLVEPALAPPNTMRQELLAVAGNAGAMLRHEGHEAAPVPPSLKVEADKELGLGKNEAGVLHPAPASAIATTHKLMHLSDLHFGAHDPLVCAAAAAGAPAVWMWWWFRAI
jgi:hypothetical protein